MSDVAKKKGVPKYLDLRVTLGEFETICNALFGYRSEKISSKEHMGALFVINQLTAQVESQMPNPHPKAVKITKVRFKEKR